MAWATFRASRHFRAVSIRGPCIILRKNRSSRVPDAMSEFGMLRIPNIYFRNSRGLSTFIKFIAITNSLKKTNPVIWSFVILKNRSLNNGDVIPREALKNTSMLSLSIRRAGADTLTYISFSRLSSSGEKSVLS